MSRLIVVSNRVNVPRGRENDGAQGGLAVALASALKRSGGIWFGWSGKSAPSFSGAVDYRRHGGVATATVDLDERDVEEYYNGYANRTLWPVLHYRIDLADFDREFGKRYEAVNRKMAQTLAPMIDPGDLVWIHDYHFLPMAADLRAEGVANRIGFFLHTPWPPHRLMVALPFHDRLVRTMLAYDLIGFQADEWRESFLHYCERELGGKVDGEWLTVGDRTLRCATFPIGIDATGFAELATGPEARASFTRTRDNVTGRIIVGVDRLDYSKGLIERFNGYRKLLEREEWHSKVSLLQIAPPSRGEVPAYAEIRDQLDKLSGRINGEHARVDWVPIRYVNKGYDRTELAGIFRAAHVGLVTSLRDGMNLVAKEYVAAQDPDDPGVLLLSRFTGAAAQMEEGALIINPHSQIDIAQKLDQALRMGWEERKERWQALFSALNAYDVHHWATEFLDRLRGEAD
ncbi:alpha,alpha-trehalose-phosphate synthase (UDP-forming) [Sphingomicrobium astaxanthinifaciens]|uniref:alpha,alpha-trehalose-phosphate synthase (UDP-forming) n=1 Tax=Sphingomicrobium astaxanthinifaciens TaxID=1227949 RepID=UPI001FCC5F98|nr:trehalose-6-phosphate synthase [Sphingomicrobium astaxanthinifaciens]MCJ7420206.1 trehalose-6-phosphate synthase [Sphingomicrobium astaxanthinifaciens]